MRKQPLLLAVLIGTALFGSVQAAAAAHHDGDRLPVRVAAQRIVAVGIPEAARDAEGRPTLPEIVYEPAGDFIAYIAPVSPALWRYVYQIEGEWMVAKVDGLVLYDGHGKPQMVPNPTAGAVTFRDYLLFFPDRQPSFRALFAQAFPPTDDAPRIVVPS
jgi:hypothetical protein